MTDSARRSPRSPLKRKTTSKRAPRAAASEPASEPALDHVSSAYHELRRIIVWGQLPPGARVSERAIADRLDLSRTPVRSALHRLEQEGFVTAVGTGRERRLIVAPLTAEDGLEVFTIVGHLEGLAVRTAAGLPAAQRKTLVARLRAVNDE